MPKVKVAGVYMIRNTITGRVYIGESVDIKQRFAKYRWAVSSDKSYKETKRSIVVDMRKYGIDNFEFTILQSGEKFTDRHFRLIKESEYIAKYRSDNPEFGYNGTRGMEPYLMYSTKARPQSLVERLNRAKPVFSYDTHTGKAMLFLGGAKAAGKHYGYGKDVSSHTVKRGSKLSNRYYLIPARSNDRVTTLERVRKTKAYPDADKRAVSAFNDYEKAVHAIDKIARDFGY